MALRVTKRRPWLSKMRAATAAAELTKK